MWSFIIFMISLKKNDLFRSVFKNGRYLSNKYLVMYVLPNGTNRNRLGISVSKKIGNSVVRHRVTRLIRESYRLSHSRFSSGLDIVIIARTGIRGVKCPVIEEALLHLAGLHSIIGQEI